MRTLTFIAALAFLSSCSAVGDHAEDHWSYHGSTGPDRWGEMNSDWREASEGTEQSPINLTGAQEAEASSLGFHYQPFPLDMVNNGHTIQVNASGDNWLMVGEDRYELLQFHFHTPSEHTVDGVSSPMEVHLVHADANGRLAVVGVLLEPGAAHDVLSEFWGVIPQAAKSELQDPNVLIDTLGLLPQSRASYRYMGSLTTPPCSEGVRWIVMQDSSRVSAEQIEQFRALFGDTNRPVQPLNDRQIQFIR